MSFRLTDPQQKLVDEVIAQLTLRPTPQLRFFWRKLRTAALPPIPPRGKKQDAKTYALTQLRWQRLAALAADSHTAAAGLLTQEIELELGLEANVPKEIMAPNEAVASLLEEVRQAPLKVQYQAFQLLQQLHPTWGQDEE